VRELGRRGVSDHERGEVVVQSPCTTLVADGPKRRGVALGLGEEVPSSSITVLVPDEAGERALSGMTGLRVVRYRQKADLAALGCRGARPGIPVGR
jgi:hypothetical protein